MATLSRWVVRMLALGAMLLGAANRTEADPISFHLTSIQITTTSGSTVTFDGTVTNDSGGSLKASDFFFNFFGFDPVSVNPIQDLGIASDFLIPNGTTSGVVALFDVMLGAVPADSNFPLDVVLQDVNADTSAMQTITLSVPGSVTQTPEPATLLLTATGLVVSLINQRKRKCREN
jgi:hypothetical protein